jgi:hypothetical protein
MNRWLTSLILVALLATLPGCNRPSNVIWQRRYDSGKEDFGRAVAADGTDIIVGGSWRDTTGAQVVIDWQVLKYDSKGSLLWRRIYDSGRPDWLSDVTVDRQHNIVGVGWVASEDNDSTRLLLVKFTPQGDVTWDRQYAFGLATQGLALTIDPSDNILVTGSNFAGTDSADDDLLIASFRTDGSLVRWDTLNFGADESGQDITCDAQGNLIVLGGQVPLEDSTDSVSTADLLLVKLTPEHKTIWRRIYDSGYDDLNGSLALDSVGNIYASVSLVGNDGGVVRLLEYNPAGDLLMDRQYPGRYNASCMDIVIDRSGAVLGCGAAGPDDAQSYLGFRYANNWFSDFIAPQDYHRGVNDLANALVLDSANNIVMTGASDPGLDPDILTLKLRNVAPANHLPEPTKR